jgi:hypothetical protein
MRLDNTLRLLDGYAVRVAVKGAFRNLTAERVYITSNLHPLMWFKWKNRELQLEALYRRIRTVIAFDERGEGLFEPSTLTEEERKDFFVPHTAPPCEVTTREFKCFLPPEGGGYN